MEPAVRYARSGDGTRIAYTVGGRGPTLVMLITVGFDGTAAWSWDPLTRQLSEQLTVVRYDCRGSGVSERRVADFSLEAFVADLAAVVEAVGSPAVALQAANDLTPVAISFAAQHPAIVSHLLLFDPYTRPEDFQSAPFFEFDRRIEDSDWRLYLETFVRVNVGLSGAMAQEAVAMIQRNVDQASWKSFAHSIAEWDVDHLLPQIRARTLVVDNRDSYTGVGDRVAADIAGAEFRIVDDKMYLGLAPTVLEFMADAEPAEPALPTGMTAILFTDIVDSTALTESMGDAAFRAAAGLLDEEMRKAIRELGGVPVEGKVLGDGMMAVFTSAARAIEGAARCREVSSGTELQLHLGLHAGDVIREGNTVYGGAVNIAARVCALSEPGEILVSGTIRDLARTSAGVVFEDAGEHALKGVADLVRMYRVV